MLLRDRTNPAIFSHHLIHRCEMIHFPLMFGLHTAILPDNLLVDFRPSLLDVCLIDVEDIVHLHLRIDIILCPLAFRKLLVLLVLNLLLRVLINDCEAGKENWEALLTLFDGHHRTLIALCIHGWHIAHRRAIVIHPHHSVKGAEDRIFVAFLFTVHQEHHAIHSIVVSAAEILRP